MTGARIRPITIAEIVVRGRQEANKLLERSMPRWSTREPATIPPGSHRLPPGSFFAGASSDEVPLLIIEQLSDAATAVITCADAASEGRLTLFGYGPVSFGDPIDWHLDPIARVRAPLVHWSRLDVLDRTQVGDSKVPWELNRHQWLVWLGQAYRLTAEPRYAEAFVRHVRAWLAANPRGRGINWASSLEVALRLIAWLWALFLFADAREVEERFVAQLLVAAAEHAAHIERYLSYYYAPNTHLTGEALGLVYAGVLLQGDRRAPRWRERGLRILVEQCERQIAPDGSYCEHATCYQRYTAEIYLHAVILAARNGIAFPREVEDRLQALLDQLLWTAAPNGSMPMIGDADGGWLLPLIPRAPDDLRGVFAVAAAWFGRPDYARMAAGGAGDHAPGADERGAPEALWLLGPAGLEALRALRPSPPAGPPSRLFAHGGTVAMRGSWAPTAHRLLFDVAPLARFGHTHADLLSVQCAVFGEPCVVDAGSYCYTADPAWRDYFRSTEAHSTLTVDGFGQASPERLFRWRSCPEAHLLSWRSNDDVDYAAAEHGAYAALPDPVVHRRRVLFVKPRYWLLVDDVRGIAAHRLELRFQFAPIELTLDPSGWVRARVPSGHGLLVHAVAGAELCTDVRTGSLDPPAGWVSRDYGQREPAPMLIYSAIGALPLRIVTLMFPIRDGASPPPAISALSDERGEVRAIVFEQSGERIDISADQIRRTTAPTAPGTPVR